MKGNHLWKKWFFWLVLGVLWGTAVSAGSIQTVFAHAELISATPAPGSSVETLNQIRLTFSEPISADSQIQLLQDFVVKAELQPVLDVDNDKVLVTAVPPLPDGVYTVEWSASSADGHLLSGSYSLGINSNLSQPLPWYFSTGGLIAIFLGSLGVAALLLRHWQRRPSQIWRPSSRIYSSRRSFNCCPSHKPKLAVCTYGWRFLCFHRWRQLLATYSMPTAMYEPSG
jgi:methionine-rich copper-binding protein CopC